MQAVADYVTYQLPSDHSRVGYLLTEIQYINAGLQSVMDSIKTNQAPGVLRKSFEAAESHMIPYYPVQKKITYFPGEMHDSV